MIALPACTTIKEGDLPELRIPVLRRRLLHPVDTLVLQRAWEPHGWVFSFSLTGAHIGFNANLIQLKKETTVNRTKGRHPQKPLHSNNSWSQNE